MSRSLITNSIANAVSFGIVGILSLILISLFLNQYGAEGYGLIVISRLLLPTGMLSFFDLGLPEAITKSVAYHSDSDKVTNLILFSLIAIILSGSIVAFLIYLFHPFIVDFVRIENKQIYSDLTTIVVWTSYFLIPFFVGVIFESILKGYERFIAIRASEVLVAITYLIITYYMIKNNNTITQIVLAYLIILTIKYFYFSVLVAPSLMNTGAKYIIRYEESVKEHFQHAFVILQAKLLSIVHTNIAPVVLSLTAGVASVGIYDALVKIPRLIKTVIGQINTVILPYVAKKQGQSDHLTVRKLLVKGTMYQTYFFGPIIITVVLYSADFIKYWSGKQLDGYSFWLSTMLFWSLLNVVISVGSVMAVAKKELLKELNRLSLYVTILYIFIAAPLSILFGVKGFVSATFLSLLIVIPHILKIFIYEYSVSYGEILKPMRQVLVLAIPLSLVSFLMPGYESLFLWILEMFLFVCSLWLAIYLFGMDQKSKLEIKSLVLRLVQNA